MKVALSLILTLLACSSAWAQDGFGQRMTRFGGGIAVGEYARAKLSGDEIGADLAKAAPLTPEFLTSLLLFDAGMQLGNRTLSKVIPSSALASGKLGTALHHVGSSLKHNLVLGGAMALTQAVQVDLGGFAYSDAVRGDFSKLEQAEVKLTGVDPQSLGITLGVFAAWGPAYAGAKVLAVKAARRTGLSRALSSFGQAVAKRFLASAAGKAALAVAPVPGSRVVALGWAALDVALAIGDVAVMLQTAHLIEAPIQELNDRRLARSAVRDKAAQAELLARSGTLAQLDQAMSETQAAFQGYRNLAYLEVAQADQQLFQWLRQKGYPQHELDALAQEAYQDYGRGLALPALSGLLDETLQRRLAEARRGEGDPLGVSPDELERGLRAHREKVGVLLDELRPELASALQTERAFLERLGGSLAHDPSRQALVRDSLAALEVEASVSGMLVEALGRETAETPHAHTAAPSRGAGFDEIIEEVGGP